MEKKVLIQMAVGAIVIAFMLEGFYVSGASRYLNSGPGEATPEQSPTPEGLLFGTAAANATVLAYPDGVIVVRGAGAGTDANLSAGLSALQRSGKVSYFDVSGQDSFSIVLAQGANITDVAMGLALGFPRYSLSAKAQISLPESLEFQTDAGNMTAPVRARALIYMEPLIPVNSGFDVLVGAMVGNGTASDTEVQVAEKSGVVPVNATIASLGNIWLVNSTYAWESRPGNATELDAAVRARYPNASVSYRANSYIIVKNLTAEQATLVKNLSFITYAMSDAFYVEADFTNRSTAEAGIRGIAENASITFPDSPLLANITSSEIDEGFLRGIFGESATIRRVCTLELGRVVEIEGRVFIAPPGTSILKALPLNSSVGENVTAISKVRVRGARLLSAE